jgi:hypothetical protein
VPHRLQGVIESVVVAEHQPLVDDAQPRAVLTSTTFDLGAVIGL